MTIEEAIKYAEEVAEKQEKMAKEWHENQVRKCDLFPFADMDYTNENECKECAAEHRQLAEWLKDYKRLLEQEPCEDAVSRQVVLDTMQMKMGGKELYKAVYEMPRITPIQKWIPISERLPEDYQRVLVTIVNYAGYKVVRVAEYNSGKKTFQIKENNERWKVGEKGLLAWQQLPDPYE